MTIRITIRPDAFGHPVMRVDAKYEDRDTPVIQRYGRKLMTALEGGNNEEESR